MNAAGFYEALYYYLLHYDISDFCPQRADAKPITEEDERLMSESGTVPSFIADWHIKCSTKTHLYDLYTYYCNIYLDKTKIMNKKKFNKEILNYYDEKTTDGVRWIMMNDRYSKKYENAEKPDE